MSSERALANDKVVHNKNDVTDSYLVWMLARFVLPYWKRLIVVLFLLIGVTVFTLLPPYLIQLAVDGPITEGDVDGLIPFGILYLATIPALFVLRFGHTYMLQTIGQNALTDLRQQLFEHVLKQDMRYFNNTPVGKIVSRLTSDIEALTELLSTSIVIVISNLITLIGLVMVMMALNWRLALISLAVIPIMAVLTAYFRIKIRRTANMMHRIVADYQAFTNEQFNGMLIVQLFGRQEISRTEFETVNRAYKDIHITLRDQFTWFSSTLQLLMPIGLALVLYGGARGVLDGWATIGGLLAFIQYTRRSFEPILGLSEQFSQIQTALSAGERIARLLRQEPEIQDPEKPITVEGDEKRLSLEDLQFGYKPDTLVLRGIDLEIAAKQTVAIVGATGAGKTSLAGLIARFYDVNAGHVRINGVDVRDMSLAELRSHVMVVPQNPYCFNGTVADNLRLFDHTITERQMIDAAHAACSAPFIERLPGTYDFELLPGGANLSQGQRQLLALTRALIHNPDSILVLDEATSNIDTETEALIQMGLRRVLEDRTSVVIAHRLSTVREADRILVMKQGRVIEDGNHDSLLKRGGAYAHLYQSQFEEYNAPTLADSPAKRKGA